MQVDYKKLSSDLGFGLGLGLFGRITSHSHQGVTMFLGIYRFAGDAALLRKAYDHLLDTLPHADLSLHLCVADENGLSVFDTCPSQEAFMSFASSPEFNGALKAAGLPPPQITLAGEVHAAFASGKRLC
jgi:hypothetical protein